MSPWEEKRTLEPRLAAWLERVLEDESWRSGLTDMEAERLLVPAGAGSQTLADIGGGGER